MNIKERVIASSLIEKAEKNREFASGIGLIYNLKSTEEHHGKTTQNNYLVSKDNTTVQ